MEQPDEFAEYRRTGSQESLGRLIESQIDLAYSVALRRVRDAHLADDITQAVFIILARKAPMLPPKTNISGWVFRTTQYVAKNATRAILRRREFEKEFAMAHRSKITLAPEENSNEDFALIDMALARLGARDQEAILLKYYRGRSWSQVGETLGLSEDAARKRIQRALVRLRRWLPAGMTVAIIVEALPSRAVHAAPPHIAQFVMQNIAAKAVAAPSSSAIALAKSAILSMTVTKTATLAAAALLLLAVPVAFVLSEPSNPAPLPPPNTTAAPVILADIAPPVVPFSIAVETTRITSPLHADGTVDYVAALNELAGKNVTSATNGFVDWVNLFGLERAGLADGEPAPLWLATNGASFAATPIERQQFRQLAGIDRSSQAKTLWLDYVGFAVPRAKSQLADRSRLLKEAASEVIEAARSPWSEDQHPQLADYLERNAVMLDRLAHAAEQSNWWMPAVANDQWTLVSAYLPAISNYSDAFAGAGEIEQMGQTLCARAQLRLNHGDFAGYERDVMAVEHLARHVANTPMLFAGLMGASLQRTVSETLAAAASSGSLSDAQCGQLVASLDAMEAMPDIAACVDITERWIHLDIAAMAATGKLADMTVTVGFPKLNSVEREAVDFNFVLRRINAHFDDIVAALHDPSRQKMENALRPLAVQSIHDRDLVLNAAGDLRKSGEQTAQAYSDHIADAILGIWSSLPDLRRMDTAYRTAQMESDMARTLVVAAKYRATNGKWPETLAMLIGADLKSLPTDVYSHDDGSVKYHLSPGGPSIYSVGPNGMDDGGINIESSDFDDIVLGAK